MPLGPAYQPVPPTGTVPAAHRSAPLPLPYSVDRTAWLCRAARTHRNRAVVAPPTLSPTGRDLGPTLCATFTTPRGVAPGTPTSPLPRPPQLQKESATAPHSLLFPPPSLSSAHSQASMHLIHTGNRAAMVSDVFLTTATPPPR
jgi:hypothetical protein